jgi:hypothetical protein
MFLLDPGFGARRRALVRDKVVHGVRRTREGLGAASRDLSHRAHGAAALVRRARTWPRSVPDDTLVERVRATLGRNVSHARAIDVRAEQGTITLAGPVLAAEHTALLKRVGRVAGVKNVIDALDVHQIAGRTPALQGGSIPSGEPSELASRVWSPGIRLLAGALGSTMALYGSVRRGRLGWGLGLTGVALAVRGLTSGPGRRLPLQAQENAGPPPHGRGPGSASPEASRV